jgi:hypothetical protein
MLCDQLVGHVTQLHSPIVWSLVRRMGYARHPGVDDPEYPGDCG